MKTFNKEVIGGHEGDKELGIKFLIFMRNHKQLCKAYSWNAQNIHDTIRLWGDVNQWGYTATAPTISMKDFLKKYDRKQLTFKRLYLQG